MRFIVFFVLIFLPLSACEVVDDAKETGALLYNRAASGAAVVVETGKEMIEEGKQAISRGSEIVGQGIETVKTGVETVTTTVKEVEKLKKEVGDSL